MVRWAITNACDPMLPFGVFPSSKKRTTRNYSVGARGGWLQATISTWSKQLQNSLRAILVVRLTHLAVDVLRGFDRAFKPPIGSHEREAVLMLLHHEFGLSSRVCSELQSITIRHVSRAASNSNKMSSWVPVASGQSSLPADHLRSRATIAYGNIGAAGCPSLSCRIRIKLARTIRRSRSCKTTWVMQSPHIDSGEPVAIYETDWVRRCRDRADPEGS